MSFGLGVDPNVLDPVTNEYADIGREVFLFDRNANGFIAETNDLSLAPQIASRPEPKFAPIFETQATAPSVDTAVRAAASDLNSRQKRSSARRWLRGAFVTMLFAGAVAERRV